jgi:hypothetical protein
MKQTEIYTLTPEELEEILNQAMKATIGFLYDNDYIKSNEYNDLMTHYALLLKKPSFFSSAWKILKGKEDRHHLIIIKQQNLVFPSEAPPKKKQEVKKEGSVIVPDFKNGKNKEGD